MMCVPQVHITCSLPEEEEKEEGKDGELDVGIVGGHRMDHERSPSRATPRRTDGRTQRTNRNPHAADVSHCIRACVRGPWRDGVLPQSRDIDAFDLSTDRPIF